MTKRFIQSIYLTLFGCTFLGACSRPVAHFQRGTNEPYHLAIKPNESIPVVAPQTTAFTPETVTSEPSQFQEAYASVTKTGATQTVKKRWERVNRLAMTRVEGQATHVVTASHKISGLNRLLVKKLNKRIQRQLAPQQAKAVSNTGYLIGGAVLLIGGLILLIAGTGTAAFIGLIVGLVGALGIILGLIGL